MITTIIAFIVIFSVVVISHELGHFLLAKKNGIKVKEFSVGMGPKLLQYRKGETLYVLKLLPIGGACMYEGEDGAYDKEEDGEKSEPPEGSFLRANVWARISAVAAGPIFNILLAFLLSLIVVGFSGSDKPTIQNLMDGYPAQEAGLEPGDVIRKLNGERIYLYRELLLFTSMNQGKEITLEYERNGERYTTVLIPKYDEEADRYYIGISNIAGHPGYEVINAKGFQIFQYGYYEVRFWLKTTFKSLGMLVQGKVTKDDVAGPVGITMMIDDTIQEAKPYGLSSVILSMINIAILLSVNLGILNLLPLPALDGGRLLFMLIEVVRGKPVPPDKEGIVHFIGFVLLMALMVFVLFNDISRIFR